VCRLVLVVKGKDVESKEGEVQDVQKPREGVKEGVKEEDKTQMKKQKIVKARDGNTIGKGAAGHTQRAAQSAALENNGAQIEGQFGAYSSTDDTEFQRELAEFGGFD
jgi:hypothetical protein